MISELFGVTDTDFNFCELITGLQIQTWPFISVNNYRLQTCSPNCCPQPQLNPRSPFGMSVTQPVSLSIITVSV